LGILKFEGFRRLYNITFWTFKEWYLKDIKIYKFDVVTGLYDLKDLLFEWKSWCVITLSMAMNIKIMLMSIVELVFCEFLRRYVLVVCPRDWYGRKWVSSLRPILSHSSRGTPWFVSALKYESPDRVCRVKPYERNRNTNDTLQSILSTSYG